MKIKVNHGIFILWLSISTVFNTFLAYAFFINNVEIFNQLIGYLLLNIAILRLIILVIGFPVE